MTALEHALAPLAELADFTPDGDLVDATTEWARRALRLRPADFVAAVFAAREAFESARPEWTMQEVENAVAVTVHVEDVLSRERAARRRAA